MPAQKKHYASRQASLCGAEAFKTFKTVLALFSSNHSRFSNFIT